MKARQGAKGSEGKVEGDNEEGEGEEEKKEEVKPVFQLAEEDVEFIYDNTHYTLKDIKAWHRSVRLNMSASDDGLTFPGDLPQTVRMVNCTKSK